LAPHQAVFAYANFCQIGADHNIKPDAGMFRYLGIANNGGIGGNKAVAGYLGGETF